MNDDLISRQAAIDALDVLCQEHRYKIPGKAETYSQYNEAWQDALDRAEGAIGNLPSAQPEKVCIAKITLSEEQVREAVEKAKSEIVQVFPSSQPERKTGHWIEKGVNADKTHNIVCSECGEGYKTRGHAKSIVTRAKWKFCPNCGERMEVENET